MALYARISGWLHEYFSYDEGAYSVASRLLSRYGAEEAFDVIAASVRKTQGGENRRWRMIERAAHDLLRPQIVYLF